MSLTRMSSNWPSWVKKKEKRNQKDDVVVKS